MRSTIHREDGWKSFCTGFHKAMHSELSVFIIVHKHENNLTYSLPHAFITASPASLFTSVLLPPLPTVVLLHPTHPS